MATYANSGRTLIDFFEKFWQIPIEPVSPIAPMGFSRNFACTARNTSWFPNPLLFRLPTFQSMGREHVLISLPRASFMYSKDVLQAGLSPHIPVTGEAMTAPKRFGKKNLLPISSQSRNR